MKQNSEVWAKSFMDTKSVHKKFGVCTASVKAELWYTAMGLYQSVITLAIITFLNHLQYWKKKNNKLMKESMKKVLRYVTCNFGVFTKVDIMKCTFLTKSPWTPNWASTVNKENKILTYVRRLMAIRVRELIIPLWLVVVRSQWNTTVEVYVEKLKILQWKATRMIRNLGHRSL